MRTASDMNRSNVRTTDQEDRPLRSRRLLFARVLTWLCWIYLAFLIGALLLIRFAGDRWWLATLLLFGPRWILGAPLLLLIPLSIALHLRLLWCLSVAALVVVFPILGFCVPWTRAMTPAGFHLRVLTYNVCSSAVDPDALSALIALTSPDIVALQECTQDKYSEVFRDWHVCSKGELLVAARSPIRIYDYISAVELPHTHPRTTVLECVVNSPLGEFTVCNLHLPSPSYGLYAVLDRRTIVSPCRRGTLEEGTVMRASVSASVAKEIANLGASGIVAGDFNMPTDSTIYRRDWIGCANAFSASGWGLGHTVRGSKRGISSSVRIDHILVGDHWTPARCWVGPNMGSDHLPVIADLQWLGSDHSAH